MHFCLLTNRHVMPANVYSSLVQRKADGQKSFAVLIDPDNVSLDDVERTSRICEDAHVDYLLVGGSLVVSNHLDDVVLTIRKNCNIPIVLFPGSPSQISKYADALLYLSLISGRNADLLIGQHVISAPAVKQSGIEVISTGYMLVDGGVPTTVSYVSNSFPLPADKPEIAACTAMAGEMLGMKMIYLDAGSGARKPVNEQMIATVSASIEVPLVVGGGIREPEKAYRDVKSGADLVVVGNALEKDVTLIAEMASAIHMVSLKNYKN